jgi:hypothetical protein
MPPHATASSPPPPTRACAFLPGNHDINNPPSVTVWRGRFGGTREDYPFG